MAQSQRERDMARRSGGKQLPWKPILAVAAVAVIGLLLWQAVDNGGAALGASREENLAVFQLDDDPFLGDPEAPAVIVAYESPHCSSCKRFHNEILPGLKAQHLDTGNAVLYYIQGTIGGDFDSSVAHECVYRHGGNAAFWAVADRLYARGNTYAQPDWHAWLDAAAAQFGLDAQQLRSCFDDGDTASNVSEDWNVGRDLGARGTPTFWVFGAEGEPVRVTANQVSQVVYEFI